MKNRGVLILLLCIAPAALAGPGPDTLWTHSYDGGDDDWIQMIQPASDGGWVLAGNTMSFGAGKTDFYLIKIDKDGKQLWSKTYGSADEDVLGGFRITGDGGYILAGFTKSMKRSASKDTLWAPYLVRTDGKGDTLWTHRYSFDLGAVGQDVVQTTDGRFAVAGRRETKASSANAFLMMVDVTGELLWSKDYGGSAWDEAEAIQQTNDGGFVLAGRTNSFGKGKWDMYVIKTDAKGDSLWVHTYGGAKNDFAHDIKQTSDNGYIIAGETGSFGAHKHAVYVVRIDSKGGVEWEHTFGKPYDQAKAVITIPEGGYAVAGVTRSQAKGETDMYLLRLDASGTLLWEGAYGGPHWEAAEDLARTPDGGFILAGATKATSKAQLDCYVVRSKSEK